MDDYKGFLRGIDYFKTLGIADLDILNQACRPASYKKGQVVIAEGDFKENFHIILKGSVAIFKGRHAEDQGFLAELQQGDMFGELSFIDDHPRSATVITREASILLTIYKDDFTKILSENAAISFAIMKWMATTIRKFNNHFLSTLQQRNVQLERTNRQLKEEVDIRREKESQLSIYKDELEEKVKSRTKDLSDINDKLQSEIMFRRHTEAEKEKVILKLEGALNQIKSLSGLFPVCIKCKKIRDDTGYWYQLAQYLEKYSEAEFRESICGECSKKYYARFYE